MAQLYKSLCLIKFTHRYYKSAISHDLLLTPTPETKKLLSSYKLLFKNTKAGDFIIYEADINTELPVVEIEKPIKLSFYIQLKDHLFLNFTDLPSKEHPSQIYYWENINQDQELSLQKIEARPAIFHYPFQSESTTVRLIVEDPEGRVVEERVVSSPTKTFNESFNFKSHPKGCYHFKHYIDNTLERTVRQYIDETLVSSGTFGILELQLSENINYQESQEYQFLFKARASSWKYHVVLTKDYEGYEFAIEDKENYGGKGKEPYTKIHFEPIETPPPKAHEKILFQSGVFEEGKFKEQRIPYYENPKKSLHLVISNGETKSVITDLPNPALNNLKSEVYVYV